MATEERLQKLLAQRGLGSRREIETWITSGMVTVNGKLAKLGDKASADDVIKVNQREVKWVDTPEVPRVLMYHKPENEVCSRRDPEGRPTVFDNLPEMKQGRWISVGRLDFNTAGLLLFTNDGELANRLMHPSYELEREYAVRVYGEVLPEKLKNLTTGVKLEDGMARFSQIKDGGGEGKNHWYHVVLMEGRNREVRRLWESQEIVVSRLIRIRYGDVLLPSHLRQGKTEEMTLPQVNALRRLVEMPDYEPPKLVKKYGLPKHTAFKLRPRNRSI